MSSLLFDKVALITGASRGVGYAAARKLCEKFPGATIYLATKNQNITPELNKKMQEDFPGASEHCEYVSLDVTDEESLEKIRDIIRWLDCMFCGTPCISEFSGPVTIPLTF